MIQVLSSTALSFIGRLCPRGLILMHVTVAILIGLMLTAGVLLSSTLASFGRRSRRLLLIVARFGEGNLAALGAPYQEEILIFEPLEYDTQLVATTFLGTGAIDKSLSLTARLKLHSTGLSLNTNVSQVSHYLYQFGFNLCHGNSPYESARLRRFKNDGSAFPLTTMYYSNRARTEYHRH